MISSYMHPLSNFCHINTDDPIGWPCLLSVETWICAASICCPIWQQRSALLAEDFLCPMTADLLQNQNLRLPGRDGRERRATLQKDEAMDALQQVQIRPRKTFSSLWGERGEESS